ncbi:hypothetical protein CONPUDRAFT_82914 [Coniophora puteana RWD-64-598 SS2]|uniref:Uncharacterized protein n=1 Tax=Coniophora puteana (strain RWD-64-598) TaxID=741705 RepID=A0A5M3MKG5_CONPW|nr:uncharacterized protein CONPUDRAFT_82914 [Coniophora puteana RWD-64-598 SS2]EIW79517.1 hypothetical protein CONPUDRAFT_82914 [Coniophora puteana RWD-64-598 SS2]
MTLALYHAEEVKETKAGAEKTHSLSLESEFSDAIIPPEGKMINTIDTTKTPDSMARQARSRANIVVDRAYSAYKRIISNACSATTMTLVKL